MDNLEQTIQRLTREKFEIVERHNKEILLKDIKIQQLADEITFLKNQNQAMAWRLQEHEDCMVGFTERISRLLTMQQIDQSIDDKQMLEDFRKLESSHRQSNPNSSEKNRMSHSYEVSQHFEVYPLQTAITHLQKAWEVLLKKASANQSVERLSRYLKEQVSTMEQNERALRNQFTALQSIHNEAEKSRHEIASKMKREIDAALRNAQLNVDTVPLPQLKEKIGIYARIIEELNEKIGKLQQELYSSKNECTEKLQLMKNQSAKLKEKAESDILKKEKEINNLKNSLNKK